MKRGSLPQKQKQTALSASRKPSMPSFERSLLWYGIIAAIVLVGIVVRAYALGSIPAGINQDEAATGYDAWSVLYYGIDRNGFHLPMMFVSWGSGMYALSGYLAWPFMLIGGLNAVTIRAPHLVLGSVSLIVFALLTLLSTRNRTCALVALILLATNPWHIMISRWGLDSNIFPGLFLLGVFLLVYSLNNNRALPLAGAVFGLCLYTYGTAYVVVPLFVLLSALALRFWWRVPLRTLLISAGVFAVISLPVALFILINQYHWESINLPFLSIPHLSSTPRYQTISTIFGGNMHEVWENGKTLWDLLLHQDDGLSWNRIVPYGTLYPIGLPFALIGMFAGMQTAWKERGKHAVVFMLLWLACAVALGFLQSVNINRINIIFLPMVFFMAYGIFVATSKHLTALIGILTIFMLFFAGFTHVYFTKYAVDSGEDFFVGLGEAISAAAAGTTRQICVTDHANMSYISVLFHERIDPRIFVQTVRYTNPGSDFQGVAAFDRYTIGLNNCAKGAYGAYVLNNDERHMFDDTAYTVRTFGNFSTAIPR